MFCNISSTECIVIGLVRELARLFRGTFEESTSALKKLQKFWKRTPFILFAYFLFCRLTIVQMRLPTRDLNVSNSLVVTNTSSAGTFLS